MEDTPTKKKNSKKNTDPSVQFREAYIDYLLEHGRPPHSVYQFTKMLKMPEATFYEFYNSFTALEKDVWKGFFDQTIQTIQSDAVYAEYSVREKLLAFYYTWIETLKNNRSYVMLRVKRMKPMGPVRRNRISDDVLQRFKEAFLRFANELISEGKETEEIIDRPIIGNNYDEGLWRQVLFVLNFWVDDDSQNFERTDAAIEKAVNLSFDIMGRGALDTAFDFARFLYQKR